MKFLGRLRQTLAKWPDFPQSWHVAPEAGHRSWLLLQPQLPHLGPSTLAGVARDFWPGGMAPRGFSSLDLTPCCSLPRFDDRY